MRIGLLGSGEMGKRHLTAAAELSEIQMITRSTGPYDALDPADRIALRDAMLQDHSIDAVDICLPTPSHPTAILAALVAGKHVLCEKPLALSTHDCDNILMAAQSNGRTFMVAHVLRFFPAYRHLARAARSGELGRVRQARFTRASSIPGWAGWLTDTQQSGGAILDLLVHDFDQVIALFGVPSQIHAQRIESDNTVSAILTCRDISVRVEGGWFSDGRPFSMGFDVEFDDGRLIYADQRLMLHRSHRPSEEVALPDVDPYCEQLRYFIRCCTQGETPVECPPSESAAAVALALSVRAAIS
jgi:predicted dehydrogenase